MHPFQVIMLLCAVFMLHAADLEKPEVKLSFNAQRALDGYTRDTGRLQDSFDKDKAKLTDNVVKALEKELDATTKKGDLTGALAIKAKIDELNPGLVFVESKPKAKVSTSKRAELFALVDFKGPSYVVTEFDTVLDAWRVGFPNDALRSIKLPTGYTLTVYASEMAGGQSYVVTSESSDLTDTLAYSLGMSSFMVTKPK